MSWLTLPFLWFFQTIILWLVVAVVAAATGHQQEEVEVDEVKASHVLTIIIITTYERTSGCWLTDEYTTVIIEPKLQLKIRQWWNKTTQRESSSSEWGDDLHVMWVRTGREGHKFEDIEDNGFKAKDSSTTLDISVFVNPCPNDGWLDLWCWMWKWRNSHCIQLIRPVFRFLCLELLERCTTCKASLDSLYNENVGFRFQS